MSEPYDDPFIRALFEHRRQVGIVDHSLDSIAHALNRVGMTKLADELSTAADMLAVSADNLIDAHCSMLNRENDQQRRFHAQILSTLIQKASAP